MPESGLAREPRPGGRQRHRRRLAARRQPSSRVPPMLRTMASYASGFPSARDQGSRRAYVCFQPYVRRWPPASRPAPHITAIPAAVPGGAEAVEAACEPFAEELQHLGQRPTAPRYAAELLPGLVTGG